MAAHGAPSASRKVEAIHYGLDDLPDAWGVNPEDDVPTDSRVLLAVSRLTTQKGLDVAVRALPLLPEDTVLVALGEAGHGTDFDETKAQPTT